jgi:homocysteine S-methyltransferase
MNIASARHRSDPDSALAARPSFETYIRETPNILWPGGVGWQVENIAPGPAWAGGANLAAPHCVRDISYNYLHAGAALVLTNTFRTTPRAFGDAARAQAAHNAAYAASREAIALHFHRTGNLAYIGGSVGPLGDCYDPAQVPDEHVLQKEHAVLAQWHKASGADFIAYETIGSLAEGRAAIRAAAGAGLPCTIAFTLNKEGRLLDGTPAAQAITKTTHPGRAAVAFNCCGFEAINAALENLPRLPGLVLGAYANGFAHERESCTHEAGRLSVAAFTRAANNLRKKGLHICGGCCGTDHNHIAALRCN